MVSCRLVLLIYVPWSSLLYAYVCMSLMSIIVWGVLQLSSFLWFSFCTFSLWFHIFKLQLLRMKNLFSSFFPWTLNLYIWAQLLSWKKLRCFKEVECFNTTDVQNLCWSNQQCKYKSFPSSPTIKSGVVNRISGIQLNFGGTEQKKCTLHILLQRYWFS